METHRRLSLIKGFPISSSTPQHTTLASLKRIPGSTGLASRLCRQLRASRNEYTIPSEGACGAPIVHVEDKDNESLSNGVAGFIWKFNSYVNLIKAVGGLMDAGWAIVNA